MPKGKRAKNLVVDGTANFAARAEPNDKHEDADLTIEEATVASPRPSRKRTGDYFDFDADNTDQEPSGETSAPKAVKSKKKITKIAVGKKDGAPSRIEPQKVEAVKKDRKSKVVNDDTSIVKPVKQGAKTKRSEASKLDSVVIGRQESSKRSRKTANELSAAKEPGPDSALNAYHAETNQKPKKPKAASRKGTTEEESSTVAPDLAMDEESLEIPLDSEKVKAPDGAKASAGEAKETTRAKTSKKPAKESKAVKTEADKASTLEKAANLADTVNKEVKAGTKSAKNAVKTNASKAPNVAEIADSVKKEVKAGTEKLKISEKAKSDKPTKKDQSSNPKDTVIISDFAEGQSKPEASKSKKRKAPASGDAETIKNDILDPLSENASAKTKRKKENAKTKTKSLGNAVGELLASATESANAARASLGDFANSILGGATEVTEGATDAKRLVSSVAKKATDEGKAIAEDVAESSGTVAEVDEPDVGNEDVELDAEPDDQTAALLAGFESEGDEAANSGPGFQEGQKVPKLPEASQTANKLQAIKKDADDGPGVVYVGRIPHGFYEHEMREYFSQFGEITRLRLSRSVRTGASRHYAFIEFASAGVAKIVAETMDNYLMFGHILKCKIVSKEQIHEDLWKGANKRFKAVPWNKIEGRKHAMGVGREHWAGRIEGEKKRRESKREKMKDIGYEFEAPELKQVDQVPVRDVVKKIESGESVEEERSLVTVGGEEGIVVSEEVMTKRVKRSEGGPTEIMTTVAKKTKRALEAGDEGVVSKKAKKGKRSVG